MGVLSERRYGFDVYFLNDIDSWDLEMRAKSQGGIGTCFGRAGRDEGDQ